MILTTQVTEDYYAKAAPLFESVARHWSDRFVLGCIDFDPKEYTGEKFLVKRSDIESHRTNFPANRPGYVSMQAGEFAPYIDCTGDEIIVCIDADTILQRPMSAWERGVIDTSLLTHDILVTRSACPPIPLGQVLRNLGCKLPDKALERMYGSGWQHIPEFTASFMAARKKDFEQLAKQYNEHFDNLTSTVSHHAGTQWLINWVCRQWKVFTLAPVFQCASWYQSFATEVIDGFLYVEREMVLFNHTKFLS